MCGKLFAHTSDVRLPVAGRVSPKWVCSVIYAVLQRLRMMPEMHLNNAAGIVWPDAWSYTLTRYGATVARPFCILRCNVLPGPH